jgi:hypothetical protein
MMIVIGTIYRNAEHDLHSRRQQLKPPAFAATNDDTGAYLRQMVRLAGLQRAQSPRP